MIVSFKQNLRVINKTVNKYEHFDENGKKVIVKQTKGDSWAIRKSLHKDTVFGEVNLRKVKETKLSSVLDNPIIVVDKELKNKIFELKKEGKNNKEIVKYFDENKDVWTEIKSGKIQVYYFTKETKDRYFATRKPLDTSFDKKKIETEVTDTGIQKILLAHLEIKDNNPDLAFSPDGIDEMNRNIVELNKGKFHQSILKVRVYEKADKFAVGANGNKAKKFVEAAKGTNLFFAVYAIDKLDKKTGDIEKIRTYTTIPLNIIIDCQKQYQKEWMSALDKVLKEKEFVANEAKLQFILSPNDLVYVPTNGEIRNGIAVENIDKGRIYKMVSSSGNQCFFINENVASTIVNKVEFSALNKMERAITGEMIKEICIPIKVDRLGDIVEFNGNKI